MRWRHTLPFVVLLGSLTGCGAGAAQTEAATAGLHPQAAPAEAMREHARLLEFEERLLEMEQRLASRTPACEATPEPSALSVASRRDPATMEPLPSEGDFLTEARVAEARDAPAAPSPTAKLAARAPQQPATPASEPQRLEQLLEGLREYASDPKISRERREALRVLLRRERKLDLMNPWADR